MKRTSFVIGLVIAGINFACQGDFLAGPRPTPVISMTLFAGETLQTATVTIATRADSILPREGVPAAMESVNLRIEDERGSSWPLGARAPGRFRAVMAPVRGVQYRLTGVVLGRPVSVITTVPSRFDLVDLVRDSITAADSIPCTRYARSTGGSLCFSLRAATEPPLRVGCIIPPAPGGYALEACVGEELYLSRQTQARSIVFIGSNEDVGRLRLGPTVTFFGAALLVNRTAYLP